jgi:hypothetical protein
MRTYFWISLFTSYRKLIESNVIMIANKEFKKIIKEEKTEIYNVHAATSITPLLGWTTKRDEKVTGYKGRKGVKG